jgi:hypothetical protein
MATDPLIERHGLVRKQSSGLGTVSFLLGIGLLVAGAAIAGLHYAAESGWDQPAPTVHAATPPEPDVVETTAAQLAPTQPTSSLMMTFGENDNEAAAIAAASASAAAAAPPKPRPVYVPKPKPKAADPGADPFATQR